MTPQRSDSRPTKERLAEALRDAGFDGLAEEAARGLYDDYESPNAMPLHNLVARLREQMSPAADALIARVIDGDFDGTKEESDAWAASSEGQAIFRELLEGQEVKPVNVAPPRPIDGGHVVYAADQPEYQPLPAWKHSDGRLVTRWHLTWRERLRALIGRDLFLEVMTFNQPLQPLYPSWSWDDIEADR